MSVDDIDRLEREVDGLLRKIDKLAKPKRSAEVDDTWDDDDVPDEADDPDNPNEDDDDDEDDDGDSVQKFSETYYECARGKLFDRLVGAGEQRRRYLDAQTSELQRASFASS